MDKRKRHNVLIGILVGGVIMALAYTLSVSFYKQSSLASRNMLLVQMDIMARQAAMSMEDMIQTYLIELEWMAEVPEVIQAEKDPDEDFFKSVQESKPYLSTIFILDRLGTFKFIYPPSVLSGSLGKNYSFRPYFKKVREKMRPVVSDMVYSGGLQNKDVKDRFWSVILAAPILNDDDEFEGLLGVDIKASTLAKRFISPVSIGERGFAWLISDEGHYIDHPDKKLIGADVPSFQAKEPMVWFKQLVKREHDENLYAIHPVRVGNTNQAFVIIQVPESYAHSLVKPLYNRLLLLMIGVTLTVIGGVTAGTRFMNRISFLEKKVGRLEILIDEEKKKQRVEEITSSDYFQDLLEKVDQIRNDTPPRTRRDS